jgi:ribonuclease VapC
LTARYAVDASVLVTMLKEEPEADHLERVIAEGGWMIGWPTVLETRIWLIRNRPTRPQIFLDLVLSDQSVSLIAFDGQLAALASEAYSNFGKGRHPAKLNYGDCMAYAVAKHHDVPLLFKGADFGLTDVKLHSGSVVVA